MSPAGKKKSRQGLLRRLGRFMLANRWMRRVIFILVILVLGYIFTPWLIAQAGYLARATFTTFGYGLVIVLVYLAAVTLAVRLRRWRLFYRRWNLWLGSAFLAVAVWAFLSFVLPGEGLLRDASLGGELGQRIGGKADIAGWLRASGLAVIGILLLTRSNWRGFRRLPRARVRRIPRPVAIPPAAGEEVEAEPLTGYELKPEAPLSKRIKLDLPSRRKEAKPEPGQIRMPEPIITPEGWQLPPIDILDRTSEVELSQADVEKKARLIEQALESYGVEAKVVQINVGPTVTQFGIEPGWDRRFKEIRDRDKDGNTKVRQEEVSRTRVKVERISSLANDLALALAAPSIRIEAPVPGKAVVGIEVPNTTFSLVSLRSVIESSAFQRLRGRAKLVLALGKGAGGEVVAADLAKMPHLLIAGATGTGKTVCLNAIISCLLAHNTPEDVRFIMVDPKRVEMIAYNSIPHMLAPAIVEADRAVTALRWLTQEMENRYQAFEKVRARNLESYNKSCHQSERLPYYVLVIDELADLMMTASAEVEHLLCRLAQRARATGIHLVVATQRPSVDVITGLIKANFPTRLSFAVTSQVDSRTILDTVGAEKLLGKGDMLFNPTDATKPKRLQGVYVSDPEIERLVYFWGNQKRPEMGFVDFSAALKTVPLSPADDVLLDAARQLAREHKHISTSFLQRRLRIGYPRAARLMERLLEEGFEGEEPEDGDAGRQEARHG